MRDEWKHRWMHWFQEELPEKARIEVVGSGGKTTLINNLARRFASEGRRVAITTSTHMYPISGLWRPGEVAPLIRPGEVVQLGQLTDQGKIKALPPELMDDLEEISDIILVEADGSKRLPLKYPATHEPVLSERRTHTIIVQGMSALGQPPSAVCHRYELAKETVKDCLFEDDTVVISDMATLLTEGYRKVYTQGATAVLLNQADLIEAEQRENIVSAYRRQIRKTGLAVEMAQLTKEKAKIGLVVMASGYSRRFGDNKLLYQVDGRPLVEHVLTLTEAVVNALWYKGIDATAVIVSRQPAIREKSLALGLQAVDNPYSEEGISASIRIGTGEVCLQGADKLLFLVADQPWLRLQTVLSLVEAALETKKGLIIPCFGDRAGNPCVFDRRYRDELMALTGEEGGKTVIRRHPEDCVFVEVDRLDLVDIDNKEQIRT